MGERGLTAIMATCPGLEILYIVVSREHIAPRRRDSSSVSFLGAFASELLVFVMSLILILRPSLLHYVFCHASGRHVARLYIGSFVLASEQARHQSLLQ